MGLELLEDPLVVAADKYAEELHKGQKRKWKGDDYIVHPRRVAHEVALVPGATKEMVAAAKLHDTAEDCGVSYHALRLRFGETVANYVIELTTPDHEGKNRAEKKAKEAKRLSTISREAKIIKMCDRTDNLMDLDPKSDFASVYAKESLNLAEAVGDAHAGLKTRLVAVCKSILDGR